MDINKKVNFIRIASTLNWALGIICALISITAIISIFVSGKMEIPAVVLIIVILLSLVYCFSGWGLRNFTKWAGILTLIISGLFLVFFLLSIVSGHKGFIGLIISITIITLVLLGWKVLR